MGKVVSLGLQFQAGGIGPDVEQLSWRFLVGVVELNSWWRRRIPSVEPQLVTYGALFS